MAKKKGPRGNSPRRPAKQLHRPPARGASHPPRERMRTQPDSELMREAAPLFEEHRKDNTPEGLTEAFAEILSETDDLAEEPELHDYFIDPAHCLDAVENAFGGVELHGSFDGTSDEHNGRMLQAAEAVLTPKVLGEISKRFQKMRARFTKAGDQRSVARTAVVLLALNESPEVRAGIGAVLKVVLRSVQAGMDMAIHLQEMVGSLSPGAEGTDDKRMAELLAAGQLDGVFEQFPGMRESMTADFEQTFEAIVERIQSGEIVLGVFDDIEVLDGYGDLMFAFLNAGSDEKNGSEPSTAVADAWYPALRKKLVALLTPQRTERLRKRLKKALKEPALEEVQPVVTFLLDALGSEPLEGAAQSLLLSVMIGEVLNHAAAGSDDLE